MPPSEIDDIFALSKGKANLVPQQPLASSSAPHLAADSSHKKRSAKEIPTNQQKKRSYDNASLPANGAKSVGKRRAAETVVEPSLHVTFKQSTIMSSHSSNAAKKRKLADKHSERFKDSRGTGPRRKTDEGFFIYKEDELGITVGGGDTPLCPFDCECCF